MSDLPPDFTPDFTPDLPSEHLGGQTPPDRLSLDPGSPHHDPALLERGVGIRFKGVERTNVEEYCVSEGWIRVQVGKKTDRRGAPLTVKLQGVVEPYYRTQEGA